MELLGLFPIPVGIIYLDRELTTTEKKELNKNSKLIRANNQNYTSVNNYVLDSPELSSLKKFCVDGVKNFVNNVNPPYDNLNFYITQSWINYTDKTQGHHPHLHPNSIISGVFYLNANKEHDKIYFMHPAIPTIKYNTKQRTPFNSETWFVPVETNMLILFPSTLNHYVATNEHPYKRESLSFNTFIKGHLGDNKSLTELIL